MQVTKYHLSSRKFRVWGLGLGFWVLGLGFGFRVWGLGFKDSGELGGLGFAF